MALIVKVKDIQTGEMVDGEMVRIKTAEEPFSHIMLADGTEITMRTTITQVIRHIGQWDDKGNPRYTITATGSTTITSPDKLKRPH